MNILFIGDVVGKPGREVIKAYLPELKIKYNLDVVICNAENSAGGSGITFKVAEELFKFGVDILTLGNHTWDKKEAYELVEKDDRVIRPINYPEGIPGNGYKIFTLKDKNKIAIINALGRIYMNCLECPFKTVEKALEDIKKKTNIIIVDFHAEATSEKVAFGWYFAKKVSAVLGTHTHIQTADEKILLGHTAYITDVGMTGPIDSVLGVKKDLVIKKFLTGMPVRFDVSKNPGQLNAVLLKINNDGKAKSIQRINMLL